MTDVYNALTIEADIICTSTSVKDLQWNLASLLCDSCESRDGLDSLHNLPTYDRRFRQSRTEEQDVAAKTSSLEGSFDMLNEIPVKIIQYQDLDVRDVFGRSSRQRQAIIGLSFR